jgi:hypothetical protein
MTYIQWVHAEPLQLVQGTEQVLPTAADFISEDVPSGQIVFGSMLIVAWVMSDPVTSELMGRLVIRRR